MDPSSVVDSLMDNWSSFTVFGRSDILTMIASAWIPISLLILGSLYKKDYRINASLFTSGYLVTGQSCGTTPCT